MRKIYLLDCTLRDGGYVNDWKFGRDAIKGISQKICQTGIEIFEVGFIKGDSFDPDKAVFPDLQSIEDVIAPKSSKLRYVGMIDMSNPVPLERLVPCNGRSVDGIRVIFKKDKIDEAYEYCRKIQELGYFISVNIVSTDLYSDAELIDVLRRFNSLKPFAVSIVDTFGLIKRKQFLKMAYLFDSNLDPEICLAYHAHNNLQQAFGNAEALVEMNLKRDLVIDACIFGMGRGAGNLNLELFAEYMNENFDTDYKIEPMLEIMDEYLNNIYKTRFWGYSIPLYLSASSGVHPNYSIYLAEKGSLTVKSFNEILKSIPDSDKIKFSKETAEKYYLEYMDNYIDDKDDIARLSSELKGRKVIVLCPGKNLFSCKEKVLSYIKENNCLVFAANFLAEDFAADYIFSSNMRRFSKMQNKSAAKCIITSNMKEALQKDYVFNYASYTSEHPDIVDNAALMLLKLLMACGVTEAAIAGMDGYVSGPENVYYNEELSYDYSSKADIRNELISGELQSIGKTMRLELLTPSLYPL